MNDLKELKLKGLPKRELEKWTKSGISEAQGRPDHAIKNHPFSPKTVNLKAAAVGNQNAHDPTSPATRSRRKKQAPLRSEHAEAMMGDCRNQIKARALDSGHTHGVAVPKEWRA